MDRIIPPDEFPGAWDAGVGDYLARQFERDLRSQVEAYQLGLAALEAEAMAVRGTGFAVLDAAAQDRLLSRMEKGEVIAVWPVNPATFFQTVVTHVMEGYYSDPG
ncbi:MAG: gluconate 2-dehydrogenase subunit 3 family protein, partial [Anaerolineales bacterium]|nr:gluconate 2-dehydrogenase subunit 3 family protein [Anaerolineales bacterium]